MGKPTTLPARAYKSFTPDVAKALRHAYELAHKRGDETFVFDGTTLLTSYAKYLLEYVEGQLNINPKP